MLPAISNILKAPLPEKDTPEHARRSMLTNFVIIACFIVNLAGWIFDYFVAYSEELMWIDLIGVVFYFFLVVFYWSTGKQVISATLLFISLLLYIAFTACYFGKSVFIILYMYNLIIIAFFIFDVRSWHFKSMLLCALASIYSLEVSNYSFIPSAELTEIQIKEMRLFCIVVNVALFVVMVVIIDRNIRKMELALIEDRIKVEELSNRLQMLCNLKEEYNTSLLTQLDNLLVNRNDLQSVSSITSFRSEERERARIGKELSQTVGELLLKIKLRLGNLSPFVKINDRPEFEESLRIIDLATDEIAKYSEILDPLEFNKLKLDEAIRAQIKQLKVKTGIGIEFLNVGYRGQLVKEQELVVFRLVTDMLREIIDVAKASHVDLRLEVMENYMTIRIQDNGGQYSEKQREMFFSEFAFQERIQVIGGFVHAKTEWGFGSTALIEIPVPDQFITSKPMLG
jgi:signal transduction histidine kinase